MAHGKLREQKIATCPECGKVMSRPGLAGHMAWKHGKQIKAPLIPAPEHPTRVMHAKASLWDKALRVAKLLQENPTWKGEKAVAVMSDTLKITKQEAEEELLKARIAVALEREKAEEKAKDDELKARIAKHLKAHPEALR